ncbi:MAG: hypothetical protein MJZ26_07655 [Fibrobacter sp.]|nr:hypothetical protein [Fibrobacter sp.]
MPVTMESLKKAVNKKKGKSMVFAWLADLERAAGDLDSALKLVDGGLTLYPNDVAAMLVRAKILFEKGEHETCVTQCENALIHDPFNLAAYKIMGDAYDALGNEGKRNVCYRQFHDMDPLNKFWKEEYEAMPEAETAPAAEAAAVAAGAELADSQFNMDDSSLDLNLSEELEGSSEAVAAEPIEEASFEKAFGDAFGGVTDDVEEEPEGGLNPFEKSSEDLSDISLTTVEPTTEQPEEESGSSLFEKSSASTGLFAGLDDDPQEESSSMGSVFSSASAEVAEAPAEGGEAELDAPAAEFSVEDDPFAALAAMLPNGDAADDSQVEDLAASLDSVISTFDKSEGPVEEFPVDENISGNDVNSALSDIFGLEDDLAADSSAEKVMPEASAPAVEDKPTTVDNAFESIFGEDELPEELPSTAPAPAVEETALEAPAPAVEDKPTTVDNAFDSIFGEDELPEELPSTAPAPAVEETALEAPAPAVEDKPTTVDNAFDSIFGEDELPEELPAEKPAAEVSDELSLDNMDLDLPAMDNAVQEEPALDDAPFEIEGSSSLFEKSADSSFSLDDKSEAPALASAMDFVLDEEPAAPEAPTTSGQTFSVDSALDSLFGDDDELPEEKPLAAQETVDSVSLAEQVDRAEAELELPAEPKSNGSDIAKEMGGAFASMFGDDDDLDLPEMNESAPAADQEATGAIVEESFATPDVAEGENADDSVKSSLDKSFDSLFGEDDLAAENEPAPAVSAAETSPNFNSLENEVSGAFKGLFDMDDDLEAEPKPANNGVDFLMSGDSDDEISAGLINNPDAPLNRGNNDLDDSMKTRTLAEIYFDQGLYEKALDIYQDLAQKDPDNQEIASRMREIKNLYDERFGG